MPYMTRIPSDLHRFGLKVELVPGWETRGSSAFAPACVVDHWTAGPRGTEGRPSLAIVTNGRADLDGPLCNVYLARDGTCVVVAAGRANHAGVGGFRGLVGNSAAYGIEAECGGDGDWTPEMLAAYPRLNAALLSGLGRDASWVAGHNEWAPTRKIDIRDVIASVRANTAAALTNPEDDMPLTDAEIDKIAARVWSKSFARGGVGPASADVWLADGRLAAASNGHQLAALAALVGKAGDVDEKAVALALAPLVIQALGAAKGITSEDVEAAVSKVLARAANG
jgi:hypothetical protein